MCPMEGIFLDITFFFIFRSLNLMKFFFIVVEMVRAMNYVVEKGWALYWGELLL